MRDVDDVDLATKESRSRDASFLPKHFAYIYIVEQGTKKSKSTLEKGYKFVFENYCHDDYCTIIWTINSCRGECFIHWGRMKGLAMLTVVINALVQ